MKSGSRTLSARLESAMFKSSPHFPVTPASLPVYYYPDAVASQ